MGFGEGENFSISKNKKSVRSNAAAAAAVGDEFSGDVVSGFDGYDVVGYSVDIDAASGERFGLVGRNEADDGAAYFGIIFF